MNFAEKPSNKEKEIDISGPLTEKKRTKNWLTAASIRLKPLIMKITEVRKHSNAKCRIEITKIMVKLLKNCAINLEASLTPIVDVVVGSAYDESKEVCYAAEEALKMFEVACEKKKHKTFISVIQSNWYSLLCKLPGIFHSGNEKLILLSLKSFSGYTRILGKSNELQKLLSLSSTLKKLLFVFQISFELQLHQEISNQEISFWGKH